MVNNSGIHYSAEVNIHKMWNEFNSEIQQLLRRQQMFTLIQDNIDS